MTSLYLSVSDDGITSSFLCESRFGKSGDTSKAEETKHSNAFTWTPILMQEHNQDNSSFHLLEPD